METRLTHLREIGSLYSHDGLHDSQTHLAAPTLFYELLRRQVALSFRSTLSFSAIKIIFQRNLNGENSSKVGAEDILRFSCELRALTRSEDCVGRLGMNECVILIGDGELAAKAFLSRLQSSTSLSVNHTLRISLSMVTFVRGETGLDLLNRLDEAPLSTHP